MGDNHHRSIEITRRTVLGGLAAGGAFALSGCGLFEKRGSYRFRMTVDADTPAGLKSGSSVFEVSAYKVFKLLADERSGGGEFKGQAVVVGLPDGPLFVLLENGDSGDPLSVRVTKALSPGAPFNDVDDYVAAVRRLGGPLTHARAELPRKDWPEMVRFHDINDPKSVERVDPASAGVQRIRLETTKDEVTSGIEKDLPWLSAAENFRYSGTAYGDRYPLPSQAFRSGVK